MLHFVGTTWIIVGVVVGGVVVLAVVAGVAWYVYRKRKCKKRVSKGECFNLIAILFGECKKSRQSNSTGQLQKHQFFDVRCSPQSLHHTLKYHIFYLIE